MKRTLFFLFLLLGGCAMLAADPPAQLLFPRTDDGSVLHITTAGYQSMKALDEYLSDQTYDGSGLRLTSVRSQRFFSSRWEHEWGGSLGYGRLLNPTRRNLIRSFGLDYHWGVRRLMRPSESSPWLFMLGAEAGLDYMGRLQAANYNKPYSMDLALSLAATAGVEYHLPLRKPQLRLSYSVQTPLLGGCFQTDMGQAYYEMMSDLSGLIHLATPANRAKLDHQLALDLMLKRSSFRVSLRHEYLSFSTSGVDVRRESLGINVGWIAVLRIRRGTR